MLHKSMMIDFFMEDLIKKAKRNLRLLELERARRTRDWFIYGFDAYNQVPACFNEKVKWRSLIWIKD